MVIVNKHLFEIGSFKLSAGDMSSFKINADVLTTKDWDALARMALTIVPLFGSVVGVPTGGIPFAEALQPYVSNVSKVLVVDDVLTTGNSIRSMAKDYFDPILLVAFSRAWSPYGVHAIFTLTQPTIHTKFTGESYFDTDGGRTK